MRLQIGHIQDSRARYNALSRYYDLLVDPFQGRLRRSGINYLDVSPDDRILDVGCGTGRGVATLQNAVGPDGEVIGIDVAERMCELTQQRLAADSRSAAVCGDALALPFDNDSFDAVLVSFVLELFEDHHQGIVLDEVRRVLSPPGQICVIAPTSAASLPVSSLYERLNDVLPTIVDSRPLDISDVLAQAGFEIKQTRIEWALVVPVEIVLACPFQPSQIGPPD